MNPQALGTYTAEVNSVKTYISNRIKWMDNKLNYIPSGTNDFSTPTIYYSSENGILHVSGVDQTMNIQIVDLTGMIRYNQKATSGTTFELQAGIYILRAFSNNMCVFTTKCFVK